MALLKISRRFAAASEVAPHGISGVPFAAPPGRFTFRKTRKDSEMKRLLALPLLLVLAGAGTAFAQDVRYNFDKQANFGAFKTYRWVAIKGASQLSDLTDRQVKAAIDIELSKKGLTQVDADGGQTADLLIGYQAAIDTEKSFTSYDTGWGYGPGWYGGGWYGGGGGMTTGSTSTIYVGQLALDMYHATPQQLVWRGTVTKTLDTNAKPDKQQKNLSKSVAKLLKNYPPPVKK
jgi:Domain of unknown function (DUF4136)